MNIGFVGLGQMGRPIALNLLKSGGALTVTGRTPKSFAEFEERGVRATTDPSVLSQSDVIFLCLPDDNAVEALLVGKDGLSANLGEGQIVVDLSTITYKTTIAINELLKSRGVLFLDAPISGMKARAIDGTLTIMCGGERSTFERVKSLLDCIGNKNLYMGASGSGQLTKLINQLLFDINAAAIAEILPMSAKMGLDPDLVGEVVNSGTGRSYASEFFIPRVLKGSFSDGYLMRKAYKDLVSGAELGARHCIPMPVLAAATATYQMALLRGHGGKDKGGMISIFEELLGVTYRSLAPSLETSGVA
ncbi:NAD(P)-dependent oxidoreductase [Bradyrhizobium barranii subsp. apii]|uniref:NAD(P)-dependent oxidoreductase n=1 Tax=Bradyrhizobium barranii subsp. apii TaxID=2819348 RepID=A0A8T5V395_9BRAD|nr:NAD(P)-dependent oxidoreductase [Bradyrhizobium barranii]UPT86975.1 NAD(P)-dependent oxidoreductase [Bradyrhizobium barranii subsp. apii]